MEDPAQSINYVAVGVSAASGFVLGGIWYSPFLFAPAWMRECGVPEEKLKSGNPAKIFGGAFVLSLIASYAFAMFIGPRPELALAMAYGFVTGLCLVATSFGISYLFERRSLKLWLINAGYFVAYFTLVGMILGLFG